MRRDFALPAEAPSASQTDRAVLGIRELVLRGECGLCALPVLPCDSAIDHRDVFFSEA